MRPDGRALLLPLAALVAFLAATALSLGKPGLPSSLQGDEAAYLVQTTSLAVDGDLRLEPADIERLFNAYPYDLGPAGRGIRLPLRLEAGQGTIDRPLLYPLLAAPWRALFGVNGPLVFNMALLLVAVAAISQAFRRLDTAPGTAFQTAVFVIGLSAIFPYLFRHHPATLWLALGSLILLDRDDHKPADRRPDRIATDRIAPDQVATNRVATNRTATALTVVAGAAWALLTCAFPSALAILPALLLRVRGAWRPWLGGALAGAVSGLLLAYAGGQAPFAAPTGPQSDVSHLEIALRQPADLQRAGDFESLRAPAPEVLTVDAGARGLLRNTFFEQRRGLLPYFPLVLLALAGAALAWRRLEPWRWCLLAGLLVHVLWRGASDAPELGGTLLGDPSQAALYPLFFLLLPAMPAFPIRLASFALTTVVLGPALVASLGPAAAFGDPQAHTRGLLSRLPLAAEHVGRAGAYRPMKLGGPDGLDARLWWPGHVGEKHLDELWLLGGERVTLYLDTAEPLDGSSVWRLRNLAPGNVARLRFAGEPRRIAFPDQQPPGGQGADVEWPAPEPRRTTSPSGEARYLYPLRIGTRHGYKPSWDGETSSFYLGAALTFLGPRSHLERDVFAARALGCGAPPRLGAGETFQALIRLRNESQEIWNASGAVRVRLSYRWRQGESQPAGGPRTDLRQPVAPGEVWKSWMSAYTPTRPGTYQLEVDLVYENIAYFADRRDGEPLCTMEIEVAAADD